jgi:RNA polymerase sigma factor (sigma-70 family)
MDCSTESPHRTDPDGLFARARAGDQAAWKELFDTCYPKIVRVIRRRLNSPGMRSLYDSTDFASDVWKSLAAKSDRFDFPTIDALMAFLKRAAEQKLIDEYRRLHTLKHDIERQRPLEGHRGLDDGPPDLASADPTPSQFAQAREVREMLLAGQSEQERRLIELKEQGYDNDGIAELTGWHVRKIQRFFKDLHDSWLASRPGRRA